MLPLETLLIFTGAALVMNLSPGPSNFYVMSRSLSQGISAGVLSALGLACGSMIHVVAATMGISALLMTSATAFTVLKYAGAAYLIWLGIECIRNTGNTERAAVVAVPPKSAREIFVESVAVELLNPKTAMFFLAFLPQFVDPSIGSVTSQFLILGLIITISGLPCDLFIALASGRASGLIAENAPFRRALDRVSGGILISVGVFVAAAGDH